jgi:hypothetical protein
MKKVSVLFLLSILCMGNVEYASAVTIDIVPNAKSVQVGDTFATDIVVSGLSAANEIVSAYDFDIAYDASILSATDVSFGPYLDDLLFPGFSFQDVDLSISGIIDFAETSLLSNSELESQQPDSFTLATLSFEALVSGASQIYFVPDPTYGIDVKSRDPLNVLPVNVVNEQVTVNPSISVPEPNTLALMLIALAGLTFRQYNRKHVKDSCDDA